ncbi:carbon-nitrogen hydrolase family protein [Nesterenkonia sp. YGD6]|uniref:carbon-nitrogen hydrolase family protein n=1 Tax=Nesterenkonia sp. YGD6 TaxID=2901231 RepID=UPI001F4CB28D|nr:carbon-nitrogen hydrolase family protein [Nesterenkonia sp. YGD6]MCH8562268.1 carbon-nitrogen hydrolase family protein [Nesterenkonia sp. YGD6]
MRIAAAQITTGPDPEANLELIREYAARAAQAGARVVVFPEATQRAFGHPLPPVAEPVTGPWAEAVRAMAREFQVVIVAGMFTPGVPSGEGRPRVVNTLIAVGPAVSGEEVDVAYDKIHLYDAFGFKESDGVQPGRSPAQFVLDGVTFGLATCYDIRFPNLFTDHARSGAQVTLVPASWGAGEGKLEQWRLLAQARALDSTQYILACGQADPAAAGVDAVQGAPTGIGHSMIVSPLGVPLSEAGGAPELLVAEVDPEVVSQTRKMVPVLKNARQLQS